MTAIHLKGIRKSFGKASIFSDLTLSTAPGEFLAVVGPSGAGKTTLLRLLAGLEKPDAGQILIDDRDVTRLPPENRDLAMVFQNHALYPHLTALENLAFPLRLRGASSAEIQERVQSIAKQLSLDGLLTRRPTELSGGESQRVALGRALIRKPAALLMDEPLSSLPPDLRFQLRNELQRLHRLERRPILYVTHDHEEALALGERIAVLKDGEIQQIASPREIYKKPANRFVAGFIGRPSMNFISGNVFTEDGSAYFAAPDFKKLRISAHQTGPLMLGIRPEHLEPCGPTEAWWTGSIQNVQYSGRYSDVLVGHGEASVVVRAFADEDFNVGSPLPLRADPANVHFFDSYSGKRVEIQVAKP